MLRADLLVLGVALSDPSAPANHQGGGIPVQARLLQLLASGKPDHRVAAAIIIGELGLEDPEVVDRLAQAARTGDGPLRLTCLEALGKLATPEARNVLVPFLDAEEDDVRAAAAHALARSGAQIIGLVKKAFATASEAKRRTLLEIFCLVRSKDAMSFLMHILQEGNSATAGDAITIFRRETASLEAKARASLSAQIRAAMAHKEFARNRAALLGAIQLLTHLRDPASANVLLDFTEPDQPADLRRAALAGLRWTLGDYDRRAEAVPRLLRYLEEDDFLSVVSPALEALASVDVPEDAAATLIRLAKSRHPLVRKFALSKMATLHREDVVVALVRALADEDPMIRELAGKSLEAQPGAWQIVMEELRSSTDVDFAWRLVRAVRSAEASVPAAAIQSFAKEAIGRQEAGEALGAPMLSLLQSLDPEAFFRELYARGVSLKQKKRFAEAERCLKPLTLSDRLTDEVRFELAVVSLKTSAAPAGSITRDNELPLTLIRALVKSPAFPLSKKLAAEKKTLEVEDYYYLGFHLVEGDDAQRALGAQLLEEIVRDNPRAKVGVSARSKLKVEGLAS